MSRIYSEYDYNNFNKEHQIQTSTDICFIEYFIITMIKDFHCFQNALKAYSVNNI